MSAKPKLLDIRMVVASDDYRRFAYDAEPRSPEEQRNDAAAGRQQALAGEIGEIIDQCDIPDDLRLKLNDFVRQLAGGSTDSTVIDSRRATADRRRAGDASASAAILEYLQPHLSPAELRHVAELLEGEGGAPDNSGRPAGGGAQDAMSMRNGRRLGYDEVRNLAALRHGLGGFARRFPDAARIRVI